MAVLGSLRKNSFVLISVIGMALFAFVIAGVFDGNNFESQKPVGEVNGEELSTNDFRIEVDNLSKNPNANLQLTLNQVWDKFVVNEILNQKVNSINLDVGPSHVENFLSENPGPYPSFVNELGIFDIDKFKDEITNLKNLNPLAYQEWLKQEANIIRTIKNNTYLTLVKSGVNANKLEGEYEFSKDNESVDVSFVKIPYNIIDDSLVNVKNSEISKYIDDRPDEFEQKETRGIKYVFALNAPSESDEKKITSKLLSFTQSFTSTDNIEDFIFEKSDLPYDTIYRPKGFFPSTTGELIFNLDNNKTYGPYKDGDYYKISKLIDKKNNGNVRASHILISFDGAEGFTQIKRTKEEASIEANRILNILNNEPENFSSLALEYSDDIYSKNNGGDLGFFQETSNFLFNSEDFKEFVFGSKIGSIGLVETDFGFHIINIIAKEDLVKVASIAIENLPSDKTYDSIFKLGQDFELALINKTSFDDASKKLKLDVKEFLSVEKLDFDLPSLPNQRSIIQWLFDKDTKVNNFKRFDLSDGGFVVVQLTDKKNKGLKENSQVIADVLPILQKNKKSDIIINRNKGIANIEDLAKKYNLEINNVDALKRGSSGVIAGVGYEPKIIGVSFSLKQNETSKLFQGENGVYMVNVNKISKSEKPKIFTIYENQTISKLRSKFNSDFIESLKKSSKIVDNRSEHY